MDKMIQNQEIEQYLNESEAAFDRILEVGESMRRRTARRVVFSLAAAAACVALVLWLVPARRTSLPLTPVQIAEGMEQMMLLELGDIDSIVATPMGSYALLKANLKDGSTCTYILRCNEEEGTTTLLAYTEK